MVDLDETEFAICIVAVSCLTMLSVTAIAVVWYRWSRVDVLTERKIMQDLAHEHALLTYATKINSRKMSTMNEHIKVRNNSENPCQRCRMLEAALMLHRIPVPSTTSMC